MKTMPKLMTSEEEVVEEALLKRRSNTTTATARTISDGSTLTTVSSISSTRASASSSSKNVAEPILEEAGNEDKEEENSVYLDKNEGTGVERSQFSVKVDDLAGKLNENREIQPVPGAVRPLIIGKPVENLTGPIRKEPKTAATSELGEIYDGVELEFEPAVQTMRTHNDYNIHCPYCTRQMTKVVLRRKGVPPKISCGDLFGCSSCLSIFEYIGNILNPWGIIECLCPGGDIGSPRPPPTPGPGGDEIPVPGPGGDEIPVPGPGGDEIPVPGDHVIPLPVIPGPTRPGDHVIPLPVIPGPKRPEDNVIPLPVIPGPTRPGDHVIPLPVIPGPKRPGDHVIPLPVIPDPTRPGDHVIPLPVIPGPTKPGGPVIIHVPDIPVPGIPGTPSESSRSLEIVKSIVYGGLLESIASLSVVSSAAAADATTLNIVALGLANLVGGIVVLVHNLRDLRFGESNRTNKDRYKEELGEREYFLLHATVAVLSYIIFGLIPPVIYGFTFRETNDRDFKMLAVAAAAFLCIIILAIAKVYGRGEHQFKTYFKTVLYYLTSAIAASGVAFAVGELAKKLLEQLGWLDSGTVEPRSFQSIWASQY